MINEALKSKHMSIYKCSKMANIPYSTLIDIIKNKSTFANCSIKTIYKLANVLDVPIEKLIKEELTYRMPFEEFKSELCHILKTKNDIEFIKYILMNNLIIEYYNKKWYEEALYTLALLDYISNKNSIPLASEYDFLRQKKLSKTIYPRDINMISYLNKKYNIKNKIKSKAIPEFLKYNIMETDVRNVK